MKDISVSVSCAKMLIASRYDEVSVRKYLSLYDWDMHCYWVVLFTWVCSLLMS